MIPTLQLGQFGRSPAGGRLGLLDEWLTNTIWNGGLSQLVGVYAGPYLRIRRSGDNAESDIGRSGTSWDAAAAAAFCVAGGGTQHGYVVTLYDQLGGSVHATQATTGRQPQIVSSGVALSEIAFDGSDDLLTISGLSFSSTNSFTHYLRGWLNSQAGTGPRLIDTTSEYNMFFFDAAVPSLSTKNGGFFRPRGDSGLSSTGCLAFRADGSAADGHAGNRMWRGASEVGTAGATAGSWSTPSAITTQTIYLGNRADAARASQLRLRNYALRRIADAPADIVTINGLLA
jgi:hypothetical protein